MSPSGPNSAEKSLGEIVAEVSEKASLLVRQEIELAKAEVVAKARTLGKGAAVAGAAGVFLVFAVVMLLHTLAWFLTDLLDQPPWVGFGLVTLLLIGAGVLAGLQAKKWLATGPPTPDAAIQEAKITRETLERQSIERDQVGRSLDRANEEARS
ncbi:MAG TPA: phage holin family protein [Thermoleophilaceae bacterium]|nr:phage holin family protein [Thermoleophilaceae bacterium]